MATGDGGFGRDQTSRPRPQTLILPAGRKITDHLGIQEGVFGNLSPSLSLSP